MILGWPGQAGVKFTDALESVLAPREKDVPRPRKSVSGPFGSSWQGAGLAAEGTVGQLQLSTRASQPQDTPQDGLGDLLFSGTSRQPTRKMILAPSLRSVWFRYS